MQLKKGLTYKTKCLARKIPHLILVNLKKLMIRKLRRQKISLTPRNKKNDL